MGFYWVAKQKKLLNKEEATDYLSGRKKNCKPFETNVTIKEHIIVNNQIIQNVILMIYLTQFGMKKSL